MIIIQQNNYECEYEIRLFYKIFFDEKDDVFAAQNFEYKDGTINVYTHIIYENESFFDDFYLDFDEDMIKTEKRSAQKKIFTVACTRSFVRCAEKIKKGIELPWGVMCGIRPAKNARELMKAGWSVNEVIKIFEEIYNVTPKKALLACEVAQNELPVTETHDKNSVGLYIGIPFCPTRCLYCSFVSTDIRVSGKYMNEFVDKLKLEIKKAAEIVKKMSAYVESIYIGGGTPTTLDANMLESVLKSLNRCFDLSRVKEFTLEAGRADTITVEKLEIAKKYGVDRISINPQTMNNKTLEAVRRRHSADMVRDAFKIAKTVGFDVINADLIAGLPGENADMFKYSLEEIIKLKPQNITIHSLCLKRAADLRHAEVRLAKAREMNEMLSYAQKRMEQIGKKPYYMYRQKNILGNLENVGYSDENTMSIYNIKIMDENQTVIALGGGGSTKIVGKGRIERIFNFKDPLEYIRRFDEILRKKDEILNKHRLING